MRILIFGRNSWLASCFKRELGDEVILSNADILDTNSVAMEIVKEIPDVVINCAGETGRPNIDWCEENKAETLRTNVAGAVNLASICDRMKVYLVHISSGCVFTEENPIVKSETDKVSPGSYYSLTKVLAEQAIESLGGECLILRIRMPIDAKSNPRNLIDKLSHYHYVIDSPNSMTIVPDMIRAILFLAQKKATGVFNLVNPGVISPADVMNCYKEIVDPGHKFNIIHDEELYSLGLAKTKRSNTVLSSFKLLSMGVKLERIEKRIVEVMGEYAEWKTNESLSRGERVS